MLRVEVKDTRIEKASGVKDGKTWASFKQSAWLHLGKAYPLEVKIRLKDKDGECTEQPFPVGEYAIGPECFWVDRFGNVVVDLKKMQPVKAAAVGKVA